MKCHEVMSRDVKWIGPEELVVGAARLMAYHNVGFLPVCDPGGKVLGVVTDRDLAVRVVGEARPLSETNVAEVMSRDLVMCFADTRLKDVEDRMVERKVSRLPVVEAESGIIAGVITLADIVQHEGRRRAVSTAQGVKARETGPVPRAGHPEHADAPTPRYFHGKREEHDSEIQRPPRTTTERDAVIRGGWTGTKEFG